MEIGPVENGLGERAMDLGQGGHEVLQGHEDLAAAVLRIRDIFWSGSGSGSGSADICLVLKDPDPDSNPDADLDPAIFVIDLPKMQTKNNFFFFSFLLIIF